MQKEEFIEKVIGKPWVNRSCTFDAMDCWALVVLYYRHVLNKEIHHDAGYESNQNFLTCYQGEVNFWRKAKSPIDNGIFIGYIGSQPAHIGVIMGDKVLHSRGENGHVRLDRLIVISRLFTRLEFLTYVED